MLNRKIFIILLIITLLGVSAFSYYKYFYFKKENTELQEKLEYTYPDIYNYLNSITVDTFKSKIENNESFIIYLGRPTCSDCNLFEPSFIHFIKDSSYKQKILYLNVAQLQKDESSWEAFKHNYELKYTPTLAYYEDGKLSTKIEWTPEDGIKMSKVIQWLDNLILDQKV